MPLLAHAQLDYGYPWWLSHGHLVLVAASLSALLIGYKLTWSKWAMLLCALLALWSTAAFAVLRFGLDVNGEVALPTTNFLRAGKGRVLDLGAGTGRSSIMVLEARPQATLVATDLFAESFETHFGREVPGPSPQERLMANLKAAGVSERATIQTADMRKLPFEASSFDAIVSAYAVDHLNRQGIDEALAEAARVIKPGGDFLLIVLANDFWGKFTFGPLLTHGGTRPKSWWPERVKEAGFAVLEQGNPPITIYLLARRL